MKIIDEFKSQRFRHMSNYVLRKTVKCFGRVTQPHPCVYKYCNARITFHCFYENDITEK